MSRMRSGAAFAALVAVTTFATAAQASTYTVTTAGVYNYGTVRMTGTIAGFGCFDRTENAGPIVLKGVTDTGKPFSIITYCFDILHNINVGFGYQAGVNYLYTSGAATSDLSGSSGTGNALSATQIERMSGLAHLGASLYAHNARNLTARMSAIQSAIWTTEYGFTASQFSAPGAQAYYTGYQARSFPGASVPVLVSRDAQGQVIGAIQAQGIGSVPEPASWALMIIGFGAIGVSARRRQQLSAVAA